MRPRTLHNHLALLTLTFTLTTALTTSSPSTTHGVPPPITSTLTLKPPTFYPGAGAGASITSCQPPSPKPCGDLCCSPSETCVMPNLCTFHRSSSSSAKTTSTGNPLHPVPTDNRAGRGRSTPSTAEVMAVFAAVAAMAGLGVVVGGQGEVVEVVEAAGREERGRRRERG